MYNQRIYYVNPNPNSLLYRQPPSFGYHPANRINNNQSAPQYPQENMIQHQNIQAVEGILIEQEYEPQKGDPMVIEEAVFKGEVVKVGDKRQEEINANEAVMAGDGYVSEDGKNFKIAHRIMMTVFKLGKLQIKNVTKVKARYQSSLIEHKIMKVVCSGTDHYMAFRQNFNDWFLRLVWAKLIIEKKDVSEYGHWGAKVAGKIYKKTKIMGDWEPRYVTIDSRSLRSSKDGTRGPINLEITKTKQIWTRFEQIHGGYYLVIKLWNGILKQEFAVPTIMCLSWLFHFLGLLSMN